MYDEKIIKNSISNLRKVFPEIEFLYSVKCNSNVNVLKSIFSEGFGADAASLAEVLMARKLDLDKNKIYCKYIPSNFFRYYYVHDNAYIGWNIN